MADRLPSMGRASSSEEGDGKPAATYCVPLRIQQGAEWRQRVPLNWRRKEKERKKAKQQSSCPITAISQNRQVGRKANTEVLKVGHSREARRRQCFRVSLLTIN